ncbi:MAG TPA: ferredoxin [Mycolicibacillus parakoreensis]|uniref:Ferredoxin n=1 Tax=Mycolicibacillus parakoreensis TaxID=1069221 RepID=A0ABY3U2X8_9MYCO|nr:ferredoxin [Mycolicibacillus parakoreensis]ULN53046.2 ferredoxin [Mycolicibacillus parakoreensis]HLS00195.1 ferredoxin [Mycolicibacillus parakoreensis]
MGDEPLRVAVDQTVCIGAAICVRRAWAVFALDDDLVTLIGENGPTVGPVAVPEEYAEAVQKAADECPARAIRVTRDAGADLQGRSWG